MVFFFVLSSASEKKNAAMRDTLILCYAEHEMAKVLDYDSDDAEFKATPAENAIYQSKDANRKAQIRAEILRLAEFLIKFRERAKNPHLEFLDTFTPEYYKRIVHTVRDCTNQYKKTAKVSKLVNILSE